MAEQAQARLLSAAFPTPPPFFKHFTKQNVVKLRELRKEAAKNKDEGAADSQQPEIDVLSLPPELRFLVPPEPPADGKYKSFGGDYDLAQPTQSLEAAGIPQLYSADAAQSSQFDPTVHLQTLTRAILLNFLELVGTMSVNPTQGLEKVEDLQHLFYNVHDLINRYRPHQARESLILMMEEQVEKIKADITRVKEVKQKMATMLKGMEGLQDTSSITDQTENTTLSTKTQEEESVEKTRQKSQRSMWDALDTELGD